MHDYIEAFILISIGIMLIVGRSKFAILAIFGQENIGKNAKNNLSKKQIFHEFMIKNIVLVVGLGLITGGFMGAIYGFSTLAAR